MFAGAKNAVMAALPAALAERNSFEFFVCQVVALKRQSVPFRSGEARRIDGAIRKAA